MPVALANRRSSVRRLSPAAVDIAASETPRRGAQSQTIPAKLYLSVQPGSDSSRVCAFLRGMSKAKSSSLVVSRSARKRRAFWRLAGFECPYGKHAPVRMITHIKKLDDAGSSTQ
jgi:hypothetical protein